MGLSFGTTIGPYQIQRELGRGGMGEVFLARDPRLDRLVAIKALPEHLAADPDRLARFQREAKVLASLNHPGIGAIYGLEEAATQQYLILEFVEGKTLAEQVDGSMSVPDALALAKQIAEALEAAHEKGVIHRDLKPGNVMVTPDGVAKVLDFGLARAAERAEPVSPDAPTVTPSRRVGSPTIPGVIMGSPGYMSPEQALGRAVDKRSDIFAFGCVLYEMLTGAQAFPGENVTASLAAVLHLEPDWSILPGSTPARIRELLVSTLHKDRKQRLHDIGDARLALEHTIQGREWASADSPESRSGRPLSRALPWLIAATVMIAALAVSWRSWAAPHRALPTSSSPIQLRVDVPEAPPTSVVDTGMLAMTADGSRLAYISRKDDSAAEAVIVRTMDDGRFQRLTLSPREVGPGFLPSDPFFSPDSSRIAGFCHNDLFTTSVSGGEATALHRGPAYVATKGGAWGASGIIFCPAPNAGLLRISEQGGEAQTLSTPDPARDELSHRWPDCLPGGRHALITIKKSGILTFDDAEIALLDLEKGTWNTIIRGGSYARYVPTGHIVYARNGSIMAVGFDAASGQVTGTPVAVVSGVMTSPGSGAAQFAVARDAGTLCYIPGGPDEPRLELVWVDLDGKVEPVGAPQMTYRSAILSPDGGRIATSVFGACDAVFIYDLARRTNSRLTYRGNCGGAVWLPDGSKIAYASDADGPMSFQLSNADGSGRPEKVIDAGVNENAHAVMLDGKPVFVFPDGGDIWRQSFGGAPREKLVASQFDETLPHISPDGRWLSYASNESGQYEVYIRAFPAGGPRTQVSIGGGRMHCWAPAGDAIFYIRDSDKALLRAAVRSSHALEVARPEQMFTWPASVIGGIEISPKDQRFLGIRELPPRFKVDQVRVVLRWFDELKAKVPIAPR